MNNVVFAKTSENVRSHRDIKLLTTDARRNYLVSEPRKKFSDKLLAIRVKRTQLHMVTQLHWFVYLRLSILEMNKTLMCKFLNNYGKPKHGEKTKLCNMETNIFIVYIEREHIYVKTKKNILKQDLILEILN